jgi:hypothetical protein
VEFVALVFYLTPRFVFFCFRNFTFSVQRALLNVLTVLGRVLRPLILPFTVILNKSKNLPKDCFTEFVRGEIIKRATTVQKSQLLQRGMH